MPRLQQEDIGAGDLSWLGSDHGITNARTSTLVLANFTAATHYPAGYIPSGLAVNAADEKNLKPYTAATGEKLGFVLFDQSVKGLASTAKIPVPVIRHGIIKPAKLPVKTGITADAPAGFTFIGGVS